METESQTQENEPLKKSIRELQRELDRDLSQGRYYGMEQKIRNLQKVLSLSVRV